MFRHLICIWLVFIIHNVSSQPGTEIQALYAMLGDWGVTTFEVGDQGKWKSGTPSIARFRASLNGNFIEEEAVLRGPHNVSTVKRIYAFEPRKRRFRIVSMEKESGLMNIYLGIMNAGSLETDNILDVATRNEEGVAFHYQFRLSIKSENEITVNINKSDDRGANWKGYKMVQYSRIR